MPAFPLAVRLDEFCFCADNFGISVTAALRYGRVWSLETLLPFLRVCPLLSFSHDGEPEGCKSCCSAQPALLLGVPRPKPGRGGPWRWSCSGDLGMSFHPPDISSGNFKSRSCGTSERPWLGALPWEPTQRSAGALPARASLRCRRWRRARGRGSRRLTRPALALAQLWKPGAGSEKPPPAPRDGP